MTKASSGSKFWSVIKRTGTAFMEDKVMKLAASLSYYTILALSPMFVIIIAVASIVYKQEAIENELYETFKDILGSDLALQLQEVIINSSLDGSSNWALFSGIAILFIASTAVFAEIQDSINVIWRVKADPKKGWLKFIIDRFLSFSVIIALGFILLVSLILNAVIASFGDYLVHHIPLFEGIDGMILWALNKMVTFFISTLVFAVIFKVLPDVKLGWKPAIIGAIFTTILFTIGSFFIGIYFDNAELGVNYGSASWVVVFISWTYYSAIILYTGAEFTQAYAEKYAHKIVPSANAVYLETVEKRLEVDELPPQD